MQNDPRRRGFGRERQTLLKLCVAALAVAGFAVTWAGFAAAHDSPASLAPTPVPTTAATGTAIASTSGTPTEPIVTATTRPRTSRGS